MLSFAAAFVIRTLATALLIVIVARLAERTGPFVASTVLTLPLFAGPSYFFMLSDVSPDFLALSALYAFAGTGAVLAFTAGYIVAVARVGLALSLVAGSCAWLSVAVPIRVAPLDGLIAAGWCLVGAAVAWFTRRTLDLHNRPGSGRAKWGPLVFRALIAGLAVASVSSAANLIGPRVTGLVVAFPLTLSVSAWMVHRQYGAEFSAAMMAATQRTLTSYMCFCAVLAFSATQLGNEWAFSAASGAALLSAATAAVIGLWINHSHAAQSR